MDVNDTPLSGPRPLQRDPRRRTLDPNSHPPRLRKSGNDSTVVGGVRSRIPGSLPRRLLGQPGAGGYREHDILVVGEEGAENITGFPYGPEANIVT